MVADLHVLRGQLHCLFPDASLKLTQVRDHVVVEGQARDSAQVARIIETVKAYLVSVQTGQLRQVTAQQQGPGTPRLPGAVPPAPANPDAPGGAPPAAAPEQSPLRSTQATIAELVPPDLVIRLHLPPEVALRRKPETPREQVLRGGQLIRDLRWPATTRVVDLDATQPLAEVIVQAKQAVWSSL